MSLPIRFPKIQVVCMWGMIFVGLLWVSGIQGQELYRTNDPQVIIPDFQVNENIGPNGAWQLSPSIALNKEGDFVVTWEDCRNGYDDIYAQIYSKHGTERGGNFKINEVAGGNIDAGPTVALDQNGNFIVAWRDVRDGWDLYAQRYLYDGTAIGINFQVNDYENRVRGGKNDISIAIDAYGNFIIAWVDGRSSAGSHYTDIYAQRFCHNGTPLGSNFRVNDDDGESEFDSRPSIAIDCDGNFVIAWLDSRHGYADIYAQRYSQDGTVIGSNFKVNDAELSADPFNPGIAIDEKGNFIITWSDDRDIGDDIYAQRYLLDGTADGSNFKVNDDEGDAKQYKPCISADPTRNFIIMWADERSGSFDIYGQKYSCDGTPVGGNFTVYKKQGNVKWVLRLSMMTVYEGNFALAWEEKRDIYADRIFGGFPVSDSNWVVNDDVGSADQLYSSIAVDNNGNFLIV